MAYLGVYTTLIIASILATSTTTTMTASLASLGPGLVLILAGVYQLSPLKSRCLSHCVSPLGFFARHSERGLLGSVRMGLSHGIYCVGCCWAYMLVMLVVAAMSIPFMAILAAVIALEKVIIRGANWFTWAIAGSFIFVGLLALFIPSMLGLLSLRLWKNYICAQVP